MKDLNQENINSLSQICDILGKKLISSDDLTLGGIANNEFSYIFCKQLPVAEAVFGRNLYGKNPEKLINIMRIVELAIINAANASNFTQDLSKDMKKYKLWLLDYQSNLMFSKINFDAPYSIVFKYLPTPPNLSFISKYYSIFAVSDKCDRYLPISIGVSNRLIGKTAKGNLMNTIDVATFDYVLSDKEMGDFAVTQGLNLYKYNLQYRYIDVINRFANYDENVIDQTLDGLQDLSKILQLKHNIEHISNIQTESNKFKYFAKEAIKDGINSISFESTKKLIELIFGKIENYEIILVAIENSLIELQKVVSSINCQNLLERCFRFACESKKGFSIKFLLGLYYFVLQIEKLLHYHNTLDNISIFAVSMMKIIATILRSRGKSFEEYSQHPVIEYYKSVVSRSSYLQLLLLRKTVNSDFHEALENTYFVNFCTMVDKLSRATGSLTNTPSDIHNKLLTITNSLMSAMMIRSIIIYLANNRNVVLNKESEYVLKMLTRRFLTPCYELMDEIAFELNRGEHETARQFVNELIKYRDNFAKTIKKVADISIKYATASLQRRLEKIENIRKENSAAYLLWDQYLNEAIRVFLVHATSVLLFKTTSSLWTAQNVKLIINKDEFDPILKVLWYEKGVNTNHLLSIKRIYDEEGVSEHMINCVKFIANKQLQSIEFIKAYVNYDSFYLKMEEDGINHLKIDVGNKSIKADIPENELFVMT